MSSAPAINYIIEKPFAQVQYFQLPTVLSRYFTSEGGLRKNITQWTATN